MRFPTIKSVAKVLAQIKRGQDFQKDWHHEIVLMVRENGDWRVQRTSVNAEMYPCKWWGYTTMTNKDNSQKIARGLVNAVKTHAKQHPTEDGLILNTILAPKPKEKRPFNLVSLNLTTILVEDADGSELFRGKLDECTDYILKHFDVEKK